VHNILLIQYGEIHSAPKELSPLISIRIKCEWFACCWKKDLVEPENRLWLFRSLVRGGRGDGNLISTSYLSELRQVMDDIPLHVTIVPLPSLISGQLVLILVMAWTQKAAVSFKDINARCCHELPCVFSNANQSHGEEF
jgi:hypothetical protein